MVDAPSRGVRERVRLWWDPASRGPAGRALSAALVPAEAAYRLATVARNRAYDRGLLPVARAPVPVISVGNLIVGGAGKTPVARWLVRELLRRGARPAVLHGGYASDEPALHRAWHPDVPVIAERDRVRAATRAVAEGATVLVLDDGFQHRRLARDLDLVLVPAERWSRRPALLPRGPWREPPAALARAHAVAVTRKVAAVEAARAVAAEARPFAPEAAWLVMRLRPVGWRSMARGERSGAPPGEALAVAGVADPDSFVANAREAGAAVAVVLRFPDHHDYAPADVERIRKKAGGRPVVTTEKDMVRLAPWADRMDLWVLEQEVDVETGAEPLARLLDRVAG